MAPDIVTELETNECYTARASSVYLCLLGRLSLFMSWQGLRQSRHSSESVSGQPGLATDQITHLAAQIVCVA